MASNGALDARDRDATLGRLAAEGFDVLVTAVTSPRGGRARRRLAGPAGRPRRGPRPGLRDLEPIEQLIHGGLKYLEHFDFKLVLNARSEA